MIGKTNQQWGVNVQFFENNNNSEIRMQIWKLEQSETQTRFTEQDLTAWAIKY